MLSDRLRVGAGTAEYGRNACAFIKSSAVEFRTLHVQNYSFADF